MAELEGTRSLSTAKRVLLERSLLGDQPHTQRLHGQEPHSKREGPAPLSVPQEQLWYFSQLVPGNPVYNESITIRKDGAFDPEALRLALREILHRHEILRSGFEVIEGEPMQVVHPVPRLELPLVDLSWMPADRAERNAARMAAEEALRPYVLDRAPLLRPLLVRFAADHHRLYLSMHHLVFDGVSLYRIVLPELIALYDAFTRGDEPALPQPAVQYVDYAIGTRQWTDRPGFARRIDYWRQHLADAPPLELPYDHPRPALPRFRGGIVPVRVPRELADGLRSLSRHAGSTLFQALAAAFALLLHRHSGQDDVVFGSLTDLRDRVELEGMVGYCQTPIVLRSHIADDPSFVEVVSRIRTDLAGALEHLVPFERIVRELSPRRDPGINPLFQAAIVLEPQMLSPDPAWSLFLDTAIGEALGVAKFDLHLELDERPDGRIDGRLSFDSDLFDRETAECMVERWSRLLEGVVAHPEKPVSQLPLLSADERHRQLVIWNATKSEYSHDACVHHLIGSQAASAPDAIAVVSGNDLLSYRDLERHANRLAHRLRAAGADTGTVVGVGLERGVSMIVGVLGILKSGAAYVPLDLHHPPDRLAFMLAESRAKLVLTERSLLSALPQHTLAVVFLEDTSGQPDEESSSPPTCAMDSEALAYILYTSGSTGRPKGVQVRHRNVANLMSALAQRPGLCPNDVVVAVAPYSFDMSVGDIFGTLGVGARLVLASRDEARDPRRLSALIEATGATLMHATPATWQMLVESGWLGSGSLIAVSGGDSLSESLATALLDRCGAVWNGYGPTETTVYTTLSQVTRDAPIAIGTPITNARVYILDRHRHPVPVGVAGEIVIGGAGVTVGYVNRPDETARRFVPDPFVPGSTMYLTGDVGRYLPDGSIQHAGRFDRQVKIRGVRIEPGEIEAALLAHPNLSSAVVIVGETPQGDRRLIAYVASDHDVPSDSDLRRFLRRTLPGHMVPAAFVAVDALPINASGKVDRSALPLPPANGADVESRPASLPMALENELSRIWARALGAERISAAEDFFDLGGHSLLAVRLLTDVERELGVELPVSAIFTEGNTIRGMAALIESARRDHGGDGLVVPIQPHGRAPILFFVHSGGASLIAVRHFTAILGPDQPVLGLLPERSGRRLPLSQSIDEMAAQMLDSIRGVQEHGPYYLAGFSLGGNLAYAIATRLEASGERVAHLAILDAGTPPVVASRLRWLVSIKGRMTVAVDGFLRDPRLALRKATAITRRKLRARFGGLQSRHPAPQEDFDWHRALRLIATHVASPNTAPMDLYVSREMAIRTGRASLGWTELHGGSITVRSIPGDHLAMMTEPHVRIVAESLAAALRRAHAAEDCMPD
jgi:amino acid adenylation domain-containing protein